MNNSYSLMNPYEGFIKGNLFSNLYDQYKNYQPVKLIPNNKQAELLLNIDWLYFSLLELNLLLDVYPDNTDIISVFNNYVNGYNELVQTYEKNYGPLNINSENNSNVFNWEKLPWPWEMEDVR